MGPRRPIRYSNSAISTKSLGITKINQYLILKTLGFGTSAKVV